MISTFGWRAAYLSFVVLRSGCTGFLFVTRKSTVRSAIPVGSLLLPPPAFGRLGAGTADTPEKIHKESLIIRESYGELLGIAPGEYVASDTFTVNDSFDFRVKVFPRGGSPQQQPNLGFGMTYKLLPAMFQNTYNTRLGVYLQFLPRFPDQTVDATFSLLLKGQQSKGLRFDIQWQAGMRFQSKTNLKYGVATDFGDHLMPTTLLSEFLGISKEAGLDAKLVVEVEVKIHKTTEPPSSTGSSSGPFWEDARKSNLRVASVVVPVFKKLSERPNMMAQGVYPGVEYRILRIIHNDTDIFHHKPGATYEMKPIYPLVKLLERPWPVSVRETDISTLITPDAYNTGSAVASLATAVLGLAFALWLSTAVSFFYIPSRSMEPTLQIGDVLLVEKVTMGELRQGDIVLFHPPVALQNIVIENGGRLNSRDLFVKRIAGLPGDSYSIEPRSGRVQVNDSTVNNQLCHVENGVAKYLMGTVGGSNVVPNANVLVLGDCGNVSIDSRVWGPLPEANLVGRPLLRVWPMDRMGPFR